MLTNILLLLISVIMTVIFGMIIAHIKKIKSHGIHVEGIIFDIQQSSVEGGIHSISLFPIVRFLMIKKQWITKPGKIGMISGFYKKGAKVRIIYQEDNPDKFLINDRITQIVPVLLYVLAPSLMVISVIRLIRI